MKLMGIHFLLSYRCTDECDHCFVWSSPQARGTMTLAQIQDVLQQAKDLGTVEMVYFEGGEPFLFYPIMVQGMREAAALGFNTGIVTNSYWATSVEDAVEWLRPIADAGIADLSLSSDLFHGEEMMTQAARNSADAASHLGLPESILSVEAPEGCASFPQRDKGEPITGGAVRFRGRAVAKLTEGVPRRSWVEFTECPDEDFVDPGRVHVDTFGHVHLCQGVLMGNLWQQPLTELIASYHPESHPVIGPLLEGGPAALVERYNLPHEEAYIDACHLCYTARDQLRERFPEFLAPATVYGEL
ncbi:MAG TPA: radical SAM protein [Anaerolineae bacterium]|nr:radical SAM protein [Anaerolineae bacterium]